MTASAAQLLRRGLTLEWMTLGWNVVGTIVGLAAAVSAGSVALSGFGLDSLVEILASAVVIWQLEGEQNSRRETRAMRIIGSAFFALALYVFAQATWTLATGTHAGTSPVGIVWLALTFVVMVGLAAGKRVTGLALGNDVLVTEARVATIDAALAASVLLGLVLNAAFGWWWADPFAGLVIVFYGFKEGREAWRHGRDEVPSSGLGDVRLNALTPRRVREWHSKLVLSGAVSANTAAKCYRVLRTILGTAVSDELIIANPCKVDGAGVERVAERPVATIPEVFAVADAMPGHLRVFVLLAGFCGLRLGELLGLERRHVNLLRSLVTIEQQEHQLRNGLLVLGPPKSDAGRRTIAVPAFLVAELEGHLEQYTAPQPEARVFRGERGGSLRRHVVQKYWIAARSTTNLPDNFRLHDLRHTANTLAAATGASTKELMHRMGHASSQAAIRYQHATRERDDALAFALDELVEASRGIPRDIRGMNAVRGPDELAEEGATPSLTRAFIGAGDENRTRVLSLGS